MYELRSLTLNSDPNGFKVGEVFCAASPSWGGELDILVVVRPIGHTGLISDRYAEKPCSIMDFGQLGKQIDSLGKPKQYI